MSKKKVYYESMKRRKKNKVIGFLSIFFFIIPFSLSFFDTTHVLAAETKKQTGQRLVKEFQDDCENYTNTERRADDQDKRCQTVYEALTNAPYDCSTNIVSVSRIGSGRGGVSSKASIQREVLNECKNTINNMEDSASTSAARTQANDAEVCKSKTGTEREACIKGFLAGYNNEDKSLRCSVAEKDACEEGYEAGASARPVSTQSSDEDTDSNCSGGPMGWLFCPMIEYMANTINSLAMIIDSLMQVRFISAEGPVAQIEKGWRTFLSYANILLVIAFLIIIFSQATQAGLSNYNVKRTLPRLVLAAIFHFICVQF